MGRLLVFLWTDSAALGPWTGTYFFTVWCHIIISRQSDDFLQLKWRTLTHRRCHWSNKDSGDTTRWIQCLPFCHQKPVFETSSAVIVLRADWSSTGIDHHSPALLFTPGGPGKFACRLTVFEPHRLSLFCAPSDPQLCLNLTCCHCFARRVICLMFNG